jgi:hypothetical protein
MVDMCILPNQEFPGVGVWFTRKDEVVKFMTGRQFSLDCHLISFQNDYDLRKSEKWPLTGLC